jgi:hypothetical protein
MKRIPWISMFFLVAACSDPKPMMTTGVNLGETEEGGETTEGDEETGGGLEETGVMPATSGQSVTTEPDGEASSVGEASSGVGEETGPCNFICPDDMEGGGECDPWAQDCKEGEKCSAYADNGGNSWNNTKCVPVAEEAGVPGDPCTVEGSGVSGFDSCAKGAMCWDVDPMTNKGACIDLCDGTPDAPLCESGFACAIANDVLNLCLPDCDPLAQDCANDNLCIPSGEGFVCVLDASNEEGQAFDPCEYGNACDKGLYCMDPAYGSECDAAAGGCCLPFCDLSAPDCPGAGQVCLAWYEEGTAPPGFEDVGICGLMM